MEITLGIGAIIALITALVQIAKNLGLPNKYAPFSAIALGVLISWAVGDAFTGSLLISGVALGLTSMGLYDIGGRNVLESLGKKVTKK